MGASEMVVASSRQSFCAHLSPDGQWLAFISDRSGNFEVWMAKADGSDPVQLTHFQGPMAGSPRWSPDSRSLAFDARVDGHAAIFILTVSNGATRRLNNDRYEERMPSWSHDGRYLYVCSNRGGRVQLWKAPVDGGAPTRLSDRIAFTSAESLDGKTVYFTGLGAGLWRVGSSGGVESQVPELRPYHAGLYFAVTRSAIYMVDQEMTRNIIRLALATGKIQKIGRIEKAMVIDTSSLDVSEDDSQILYSQVVAAGSDLMLARNWRP